MTSFEEPVQCHFPVLEAAFSPDEIQELLSLCQSEMPALSTSGSETSRSVYSLEERKSRRMISNRESARRSRLRKKRQLEDLTNEVNRLKIENRELKDQLCLILHHYYTIQRESGRLIAESIDLQTKLAGLHEIMATMQASVGLNYL